MSNNEDPHMSGPPSAVWASPAEFRQWLYEDGWDLTGVNRPFFAINFGFVGSALADGRDATSRIGPSNHIATSRAVGASIGSQSGEARSAEQDALPARLPMTVTAIPNDTLYLDQWHLFNYGKYGGLDEFDINVYRVWDHYSNSGVYIGRGIHIGIFDQGIEYTHADLDANYDATRHVVIDGTVQDPFATTDQYHGTAVAGMIAAESNGVGTVGVAHGAKITGVDVLSISTEQLFQAMAQQDGFDVVNHSWGWTQPFFDSRLSPSWSNFYAGLEDAVMNGRGGLGTVITAAAGNDRTALFNSGMARDTNDSNFTSSPYVIAVAAVNIDGSVANYSTPGASLLISAPSSEAGGVEIWTTDRTGSLGYNTGTNAPSADNAYPDYTANFGGTSAAAPIVAGVVALMLEANPNLGWRDVQEILAYSARHVGSGVVGTKIGSEFYNWGFNAATNWNGGGLHFSNDYGFGSVDALAAVRLAESWTETSTSANQTVRSATNAVAKAIPDNNANGVTYTFEIGQPIDVERATIALDMENAHTHVGDLVITLTSPSGTVSTLLNRIGRVNGIGFGLGDDLEDWVLSSNTFRGESGVGTWTLKISDHRGANTGSVAGATLSLYGAGGTADDTYIYTDEFPLYANLHGHATTLTDADGGIDAINGAALTGNSVIDLNPGAVSTIAGRSLTIAAGTIIENAFGGDYRDTLRGNDADNRLEGGRGDDTIVGGNGSDTAVYNGSILLYTMRWNGSAFIVTGFGPAAFDGTDTVSQVEKFSFADRTASTFTFGGDGWVTEARGAGFAAFFDPANAANWTSYLETFDAGGQRLTQFGNYDNGSSWKNYWDPSSQFNYVSYSEHYVAGGALSARLGTYDTGESWANYWDPAGLFNYVSYSEHYVVGGAISARVGAYDSGESWANYWDPLGIFNYLSYSEHYVVGGAISARVGTYDSGESWANYWDPLGIFNYVSYSEHYVVGGAISARVGTYDSGESWANYWDPLGIFNYASYSEHYLVGGARSAQVGTYDNGESWKNFWDPANAQAWSSISEHYDTAGDITIRITTWDDGHQTTDWFL